MRTSAVLAVTALMLALFCTQDKTGGIDINQVDPLDHPPSMKVPVNGTPFDVAVAETLSIVLAATHPAQYRGWVTQFEAQYSADGKKVWSRILPAVINADKSFGAIFTDLWPASTPDTTIILWIRAKDNDSTYSDSINVSIRVHQYRPVVSAAANAGIPIRRTLILTCSAHDTLSPSLIGKPKTYFWMVSPSSPVFGPTHAKTADTTSDSTVSAFFRLAGIYTVSVCATDKDSLFSNVRTCTVTVSANPPVLHYAIAPLHEWAGDPAPLPLPSLDSIKCSPGVQVLSYRMQFSWDAQILDTSAYNQPLLSHRDQLVLPASIWENKTLSVVEPLDTAAWYCVQAMDADSLWSNTDTVHVISRYVRPWLRDTVRLVSPLNTFIGDSVQFRITASDSTRSRVTIMHWRWKGYDPQTRKWSTYDADSATSVKPDMGLNIIKIDTSYSPKIKLGYDSVPYVVKVWGGNSAGKITDTVFITTIPRLGKPQIRVPASAVIQINDIDTIRITDIYDPDTAGVGAPRIFHWKFTNRLNEESRQDPFYVASFTDSTVCTLTVRCEDGKGVLSDPDSILVTVSRGIPSARFNGTDSSSTVHAVAGDCITLFFGGSDPVGQPLTYEWTILGGAKVSGSLSSTPVQPGQAQNATRRAWVGNSPGTYTWVVKITDTDGNSVSKSLTVIVDNPPMIWNDPFSGVWDFGKWQ
jgi:hypothetical protein